MPNTPAGTFLNRRSSDGRPVGGLLASNWFPPLIIFIAAILLCGCPRKQWTYAPPPAPPPPSKDFDVHFGADHPDPNGAARNVDWQPQAQGNVPNPDSCNDGQPYTSPCTQNGPFLDQPDGVHQAFCFLGKVFSGSPPQPFFGHADWTVAQYDGAIGWFNFGDDFDYNLLLIPGAASLASGNRHGITKNNNLFGGDRDKPYIELEWDSDETDPAFAPDPQAPPTSWWAKFKDAGHANDPDVLAGLLHPRDTSTLACGSVVGLFGLDCDHGCRSELHPIYALAIQRTEDRTDNQWSILVRNWGTGGYCSQYNDELNETSLSLVLSYTSAQPPTRVEVQDFATTTSSGPGVQCPKVYFQDGQTIVNLTLPPPQNQGVAAFSLNIQWPEGAQPAACERVSTAGARLKALVSEAPAGNLRGEDYMGGLLRATNPGQRLNLDKDILPAVPKSQSKLKTQRHLTVSAPAQSCNGVIPVTQGRPQLVPVPALHKLRKDRAKRTRDDALRNYICHQYRSKKLAPPVGTQQELDQACKGVK